MVLVLGSLIFYAYGEPKYLPLLIVSVYVNYYIGLCLGSTKDYSRFAEEEAAGRRSGEKSKKILLVAAIVLNIGVLTLFKTHSGEWGLPLGISFYTFQILSYLIDVYKGTIRCEKSLLRMAVYVTMFPKLLSGPIIGYQEVERELSDRRVTAFGIQEGLKTFVLGLALKVLIADRVGYLWHEVQVTGFESISTGLAWLAAIAYSMKIYFDFYGYSLMAKGVGRMLGFQLPDNFNHPYMARSVREFYRRWHMTLGNWFCKYVYIPLGGSRGEEIQTIRNLLIVWVLTSLWHGNTSNFLIWGMLLWVCIVIERVVSKHEIGKESVIFPHIYLWTVIPISWMCFAITDPYQLKIYLGRMFAIVPGVNIPAGDWQEALQDYGWLLWLAVLGTTPLFEWLFKKLRRNFVGMLILAILFWICVGRLLVEGNNPFMYFNF